MCVQARGGSFLFSLRESAPGLRLPAALRLGLGFYSIFFVRRALATGAGAARESVIGIS
jgi:hypothetical protein